MSAEIPAGGAAPLRIRYRSGQFETSPPVALAERRCVQRKPLRGMLCRPGEPWVFVRVEDGAVEASGNAEEWLVLDAAGARALSKEQVWAEYFAVEKHEPAKLRARS